MLKIQDFINDKNKYRVDFNYQRPNNAWSNDDKQCLIDTILKDEPMPLFFFNYDSTEEVFYIVDGQQRLNSIRQFYDNQIKLNKKYSGLENHGKTFNGENSLSPDQKQQFLEYTLKTHVMTDFDDEKVRMIFSKLQRGKPLQLGERLNAKPGKIVHCMRSLTEHDFLKHSVGVSKRRYGVFPDAARILFYEIHGAKQMGSKEIYDFFETKKDLDTASKEFKNAQNVLNFLLKCFPKEPGDYKYLEKHAWVLAVYTMIRELKLQYSLVNQEENIQKFIKKFHSDIYTEFLRTSNTTYQRFYDNIRGGWSEKIISIRRDILIKEFLKKHPLDSLDDKRQISDQDKIAAFGLANGKCQYKDCDVVFKDYKEPEYHHIKLYSEGGRSQLENIMVVCSDCHDKIHADENPTTKLDDNSKSPQPETSMSSNIDPRIPIGKYVREKLDELIESDLLDYEELSKLQSESYSKATFDIQYPLLKKVNTSSPQKIDRYWKKPIFIKGNYYLVCSEWYENERNNDRPFFVQWLRKIKA